MDFPSVLFPARSSNKSEYLPARSSNKSEYLPARSSNNGFALCFIAHSSGQRKVEDDGASVPVAGLPNEGFKKDRRKAWQLLLQPGELCSPGQSASDCAQCLLTTGLYSKTTGSHTWARPEHTCGPGRSTRAVPEVHHIHLPHDWWQLRSPIEQTRMLLLWNVSGNTGFPSASPSGNPSGRPSLGISLGTGLIKPSISLFIPQ